MQITAEIPDLVRAVLRDAPLLAPLGREERTHLAESAEVRSVPRGTKLFQEGDPAEEVFFVASGRVQCCLQCDGPREWVSGVVHAAGDFGLVDVLCGSHRDGCALALEPTKVVVVPAAVLLGILDGSQVFASHVARSLAHELRATQHMCGAVALRPPLHRLAEYLLATAGAAASGELPETQGRIASQIGTVREVVGRSLRRLERQGVIARRGRMFEILRRDELARLAR